MGENKSVREEEDGVGSVGGMLEINATPGVSPPVTRASETLAAQDESDNDDDKTSISGWQTDVGRSAHESNAEVDTRGDLEERSAGVRLCVLVLLSTPSR